MTTSASASSPSSAMPYAMRLLVSDEVRTCPCTVVAKPHTLAAASHTPRSKPKIDAARDSDESAASASPANVATATLNEPVCEKRNNLSQVPSAPPKLENLNT